MKKIIITLLVLLFYQLSFSRSCLPEGLYFCRLTANGKTSSGKLILIR
ncbi:MAG: hypothetical protein M0Q51_11925 [Bacteroidales bacterium]|nr:hypothetical protein [Bacteroidales bacterium]